MAMVDLVLDEMLDGFAIAYVNLLYLILIGTIVYCFGYFLYTIDRYLDLFMSIFVLDLVIVATDIRVH